MGVVALVLLLCGGCASVKPAPSVAYGAEEKPDAIFTMSEEWANALTIMGPVFQLVGEFLGSRN